MIRATSQATAVTLAVAALGLLVQLVMAARLGAGVATDLYFLSLAIPTFLSALLTAFLSNLVPPILAELRVAAGDEGFWQAGTVVIALSALLLGVLGLLMWVGAPMLIRVQAPLLSPERASSAIALLRWNIPVSALLCLNQVMTTVEASRERFGPPMVGLLFPPAATILSVVWLAEAYGVFSIIVGQVVGTLLQSVWLFAPIQLAWVRDWRSSLRLVLGRGVRLSPALMVTALTQHWLPVLERSFASAMPAGTITQLGVALRMGSFGGPLLVGGITLTLTTRLSLSTARGEGLRDGGIILGRVLQLFLILSVPLVMFSPLYAEPLIRFVFQRGAFASVDTLRVAAVVPYYMLALAISAAGSIITRGYYNILGRNGVLGWTAVLGLAGYWLVAAMGTERFGHRALGAAAVVYWMLSVGIAAEVLRRRLDLGIRTTLRTLAESIGISLVLVTAFRVGTVHRSDLAQLALITVAMLLCWVVLYLRVGKTHARELALLRN